MMNYAEYDYYVSLYGEDSMTENMFKIFSYDACRKIDHITTGVDNVDDTKTTPPDLGTAATENANVFAKK